MHREEKIDVIKRLTASRREYRDHLTELGHMFGEEWARADADYEDLLRVATGAARGEHWGLAWIKCMEGTGAVTFIHDLLEEVDEGLANVLASAFVAATLDAWREVKDEVIGRASHATCDAEYRAQNWRKK